MSLVEIVPPAFDVDIRLAYAGPENFTGKAVYRRAACYLHADATALLKEALTLAQALGLGLRIYDAFRPVEAQWALWNHTPDPDYLADPRRGSPHSRGVAVDLTLIRPDGTALEMGTPFDALEPLSRHARTELSAEAQRNRHLLLGIMTSAGWDFYRNEWWHYQLFEPRRYPLLSDEAAGTRLMG
ncbi:MAG: D-alanyl-D-alanine dipeptidase [Alphaproteobacteria bacterium]|nr:D-alanyl-D-alanine dipeptidase [Pseudomonadota bacterium]